MPTEKVKRLYSVSLVFRHGAQAISERCIERLAALLGQEAASRAIPLQWDQKEHLTAIGELQMHVLGQWFADYLREHGGSVSTWLEAAATAAEGSEEDDTEAALLRIGWRSSRSPRVHSSGQQFLKAFSNTPLARAFFTALPKEPLPFCCDAFTDKLFTSWLSQPSYHEAMRAIYGSPELQHVAKSLLPEVRGIYEAFLRGSAVVSPHLISLGSSSGSTSGSSGSSSGVAAAAAGAAVGGASAAEGKEESDAGGGETAQQEVQLQLGHNLRAASKQDGPTPPDSPLNTPRESIVAEAVQAPGGQEGETASVAESVHDGAVAEGGAAVDGEAVAGQEGDSRYGTFLKDKTAAAVAAIGSAAASTSTTASSSTAQAPKTAAAAVASMDADKKAVYALMLLTYVKEVLECEMHWAGSVPSLRNDIPPAPQQQVLPPAPAASVSSAPASVSGMLPGSFGPAPPASAAPASPVSQASPRQPPSKKRRPNTSCSSQLMEAAEWVKFMNRKVAARRVDEEAAGGAAGGEAARQLAISLQKNDRGSKQQKKQEQEPAPFAEPSSWFRRGVCLGVLSDAKVGLLSRLSPAQECFVYSACMWVLEQRFLNGQGMKKMGPLLGGPLLSHILDSFVAVATGRRTPAGGAAAQQHGGGLQTSKADHIAAACKDCAAKAAAAAQSAQESTAGGASIQQIAAAAAEAASGGAAAPAGGAAAAEAEKAPLAPRINIFSAHDYTLLGLLAALRVGKHPRECLGFGAFLLLECWEEGEVETEEEEEEEKEKEEQKKPGAAGQADSSSSSSSSSSSFSSQDSWLSKYTGSRSGYAPIGQASAHQASEEGRSAESEGAEERKEDEGKEASTATGTDDKQAVAAGSASDTASSSSSAAAAAEEQDAEKAEKAKMVDSKVVKWPVRQAGNLRGLSVSVRICPDPFRDARKGRPLDLVGDSELLVEDVSLSALCDMVATWNSVGY